MGRPTIYTPLIAESICERIADGESLRRICEDDGMPSAESVRRWVRDDEAFRGQYARAREDQADADADDIGDIARDTLTGKYDPAAARVAIDALKWNAEKRRPKVYGKSVDVTTGGERITGFAIVDFTDGSEA